jgi:glutaredoxin
MSTELKTKSVCPYCGGTRFLWQRKAIQTIVIDSEKQTIEPVDVIVQDYTEHDLMPQPVCLTCKNLIPSFMEEAVFHEIVCDPEYKDTVVHFVKMEDMMVYDDLFMEPLPKRFNGQQIASVQEDKFPSEMVISELYGFALRIKPRINRETNLLYVEAKVVTAEPFGTEHVEMVEHDIQVQTPAAVAGSYVFEFEGEKYQVLVAMETYPYDFAATQIDVERIISVTEGNTVTDNKNTGAATPLI